MTVWKANCARWGRRLREYDNQRMPAMKPSEALDFHRIRVRQIIALHHGHNVRVFGSALHGKDTENSDLDLLIDPTPETTLLDIGAMRHKLEKLLGIPVDVLTPNALPEKFRNTVIAQARPV